MLKIVDFLSTYHFLSTQHPIAEKNDCHCLECFYRLFNASHFKQNISVSHLCIFLYSYVLYASTILPIWLKIRIFGCYSIEIAKATVKLIRSPFYCYLQDSMDATRFSIQAKTVPYIWGLARSYIVCFVYV